MLRIELFEKGSDNYISAHEFAQKLYLSHTINMVVYYQPSVLICAFLEGEPIGVIGMNIGFVNNEMLSREPKISPYVSEGVCCEESIFAINSAVASVAMLALPAALTAYSAYLGYSYLAVLATPIVRKIIAKLGVVPISCGKPDKNHLDMEHRNSYDAWFEYYDPTSIEIVDLKEAEQSCRRFLRTFCSKNKLLLTPPLDRLMS